MRRSCATARNNRERQFLEVDDRNYSNEKRIDTTALWRTAAMLSAANPSGTKYRVAIRGSRDGMMNEKGASDEERPRIRRKIRSPRKIWPVARTPSRSGTGSNRGRYLHLLQKPISAKSLLDRPRSLRAIDLEVEPTSMSGILGTAESVPTFIPPTKRDRPPQSGVCGDAPGDREVPHRRSG